MKSRKSDLIVFASRRAELHRFLGTLQDWSALGLVNDFVFIDADSQHFAQGPECVYVSSGKTFSGRLSDVLAELSGIARVRMACISQVAEGYSSIGYGKGHRLFQTVEEAVPSAQMKRMHVISVVEPQEWPFISHDDLAWMGAHNVVLTTENSKSPSSGVTTIGVDQIAHPVGLTHQSAALCSAIGLWLGETRTFVDDEPPPGQGQLFALRTFTRHLSMTRVRSEILSQLVNMANGYPVPKAADRAVAKAADEKAEAKKMAEALLELHDEIRPRKPAAFREVSNRENSFVSLVKYFFIFLAGAFRRTPKALLETAMSKAAQGAQQFLTGKEDAAIIGTLNGVRGVKEDGKLSDPDALDMELGRVLDSLLEVGSEPKASDHEFPKFWKDFSHGALTLLDGMSRNSKLTLSQSNGDVLVLTRPESVAPNPREKFVLSDSARHALGVNEVKANDIDTSQILLRAIEEQTKTGAGEASSLAVEGNRLEDWYKKQRGSYVFEVGQAIVRNLEKTRTEIVRSFETILRSGGIGHELKKEEGAQEKIARNIVTLAAVFIAIGIAMPAFAFAEWVEWSTALWSLPVIGILWLATSLGYFYRAQNSVLKLLQQRENAAGQIATARKNLRNSLIDLRRQQFLYRQYVSWAQAISAFVWLPLGNAAQGDREDLEIGEGYCHNHQFGVLVPPAGVTEETSHKLRSNMFGIGWLEDPWERFINDVPKFPDQHLVQEDKEILYTDRAVSHRSVLAQWSEAVVSDERFEASSVMSNKLTEFLEDRKWDFVDDLFSDIETQTTAGAKVSQSYESFAAGLHDIGSSRVGNGLFSQRIFSPIETTNNRAVVADVLVSGGRGYARPLIVTERSEYFDATDLAFGRATTSRPATKVGSTDDESPQV